MKIKNLLLLVPALLSVSCRTKNVLNDKNLVIGCSPTPHAEILEAARPLFKEKGQWRGEKYTAFCSAGEMLDESLEAYYTTKLDAAHDAINTEIGELQAKKRELAPLVGGLWGDIARWRAELKNLTN